MPFTADFVEPFGSPWFVDTNFFKWAVSFDRTETTKTVHFRSRNRVASPTAMTITAWTYTVTYNGRLILGPVFSNNITLTPLVMTLTADAEPLTKGQARTFAGNLHFNAAPHVTQNNRGTLGVKLVSPCTAVQFTPSTINVQQVAGVHDYPFSVSYNGGDCGDLLQISTNLVVPPPATFTTTAVFPFSTAENYYVAVGVDDFQPAEKKAENNQVYATVALGQQFSVAVSSSNQATLRQPVPGMYKMEAVQIAPGLSSDALFPNNVALEFDSSQAAEVKRFIAVHLGSVKIRIMPNDSTKKENILALTVIAPDRLGDEHSEVDQLVLPLAHQFGVLPQFIKGHMAQESTYAFNPKAYRYEPLSPYTGDYGVISRLGTASTDPRYANIGNLRTQAPYRDYSFGELPGDYLNPGGLPIGPSIIDADVAPRSKYSILENGTPRPLGAKLIAPDDHVSAAQILFANPLQNWWKNDTYAEVQRNLVEVGPQGGTSINFTAQTSLAASYGYMQMMYATAVSSAKWKGVGGKLNPSLLFDTPENIKAGGGSLNPGVNYVVALFRRWNGRLAANSPDLSSNSDLDDLFKNAWQRYNMRKNYSDDVLQKTQEYKPFRSGNIFQ